MTRRLQLPEPHPQEQYLRRLVAELTKIVNDLNQRVEELETLQYIEDDLSRPPRADGARAIVGADAYIGIGGAWVQVT
jgi:hypothetical protein